MTSKPDFKVMVLLLVFMQLTRDLFAIASFLFSQGSVATRLRYGGIFNDFFIAKKFLAEWGIKIE